MSSKKSEAKKWVSSKHGIIIPGSVFGKDADVRVSPYEPIEVPETYAETLIHNQFAVECEPPADAKNKSVNSKSKSAKPTNKTPPDGVGTEGAQDSECASESDQQDGDEESLGGDTATE